MHVKQFLSTIVCLTILTTPLLAVDLTKMEKKIGREPAYQAQPKYGLLVFGPEAKTCVWLVLDGDTLYVDRNGDGDLTKEGEKVHKETKNVREEALHFKIGNICDGERVHKELWVYIRKLEGEQNKQAKELLANNPQARSYSLGGDVEMPGWRGTGLGGRVTQTVSRRDVNGYLQFSDRPQDAPIIHFGGPWYITLFGQHRVTIGRQNDLVLGVATAGLGAGTTASIAYDEVIPENAYPKAEIIYPPKNKGEPPIKEEYVLKRRC